MEQGFDGYVLSEQGRAVFGRRLVVSRRFAIVRTLLTFWFLAFFWWIGPTTFGAVIDAALMVLWADLAVSSWREVAVCKSILAGRGFLVRGGNLCFLVLCPQIPGGSWRAVHVGATAWWDVAGRLLPSRGRGATGEEALVDVLRRMGHEVVV